MDNFCDNEELAIEKIKEVATAFDKSCVVLAQERDFTSSVTYKLTIAIITKPNNTNLLREVAYFCIAQNNNFRIISSSLEMQNEVLVDVILIETKIKIRR